MTKLHLVIEENTKKKIKEMQNLKRSYSNMIIRCLGQNQKLKIFTPSTLELDDIDVSNDSLAKFLNSNDKLVIKDCQKSHHENSSTLNSLKSLSLLASSWTTLKMFPSCKNIQELKIDGFSKYYLNEKSDQACLTAFMTGQRELETLIIVNYFPLDDDAITSAKYNLKQFSVRLFANLKDVKDEIKLNACLLQIMARHKDTLENLEITVKGENLMEFIMKNLKVQRLFVTAELLPTNHQVYLKIHPNPHLKKLIICRQIPNSKAVQGLIRIYPRIESLIIKSCQPEDINEALIVFASTLKSLKSLHLDVLPLNTPNAPMPSLRTFYVNDQHKIENFLEFCSNIPSIETLALSGFEAADVTIENIEIMTSRLTQLQHIKFGNEFKLTSEMLDIFSRNCPKLRLIEEFKYFNKSKNNVTHGRIQVVSFSHFNSHVFKEEETLWNESDANVDSDDIREYEEQEYVGEEEDEDQYMDDDDYAEDEDQDM